MKIIYLDEDRSKLCDQQISSGLLERPDRIESTPKSGGRCLRINPDGLSMAIGDRHGNIRIINLESFQQIALLEAHDSEVLSVDYSPSSFVDVTFLASSSRDRFIHIFDVNKDYQLIATLDDHSAAITAVRFTHSQLISCSADKSLIFRSISKVNLRRTSSPISVLFVERTRQISIHSFEQSRRETNLLRSRHRSHARSGQYGVSRSNDQVNDTVQIDDESNERL